MGTTPAASTGISATDKAIAVLLEIYKEYTSHGRHLETQRQLVTGFVLTIAGGALAALATLKFKTHTCVSMGVVLVAFGLIGTAFSIVQYGKWVQSRARWRAARTVLSDLCPTARLDYIVAASDPKNGTKKNPSRWLKAGNTPLHWLWTLLMLSVFVLGVALIYKADRLQEWAAQCR